MMLPVIVKGFCSWVEEGVVADKLWRVGPSGGGVYERGLRILRLFCREYFKLILIKF